MEPAEYEKMYRLEDSYWWFQGRKTLVTRLLRRIPGFTSRRLQILDLGCGTGLMLEHLGPNHDCTGLDFSPLALAFARRRGAPRLVQASAEAIPAPDRRFDLVTALDLAEHVPHDDQLLAEAFRVLRPGGRLVLTVPAHPFLWSDHDEALQHFRRYRRTELRTRLLDAGFRIERLTYCISFTFPIIAAFRFLQSRIGSADQPRTHVILLPDWANRLLYASVCCEALLLDWFDLPFGVTLAATAVRDTD